MPIIECSDYRPNLLFRNGHINTIYPYFFRKKQRLGFQRKRFVTQDNDFYDVDFIFQKSKRIAVLMHGLEGSAQSQYILGTAHVLQKNGFDIAAIHFRSCSGEMNQTVAMYHSGFTQDLHHTILAIEAEYDEIFIAGFSLGGNVVMKYMGDGVYPLSSKIKALAGVSVPCDLKNGSLEIQKTKNHFYEKKFLATLKPKMIQKSKQFTQFPDIRHLHKVKTLYTFDEMFTAPMHGFQGADDYYQKCHCLPFLSKITTPALMINALDDSFLASTSYPFDIAKNSNFLHLMTPRYGGHVGFSQFNQETYWDEWCIMYFFETHSQYKTNIKKKIQS